jgi:hypothetical protein
MAFMKFKPELTALNKACEGKKFFLGDKLSVYDFYHYDMWERAKIVNKNECD